MGISRAKSICLKTSVSFHYVINLYLRWCLIDIDISIAKVDGRFLLRIWSQKVQLLRNNLSITFTFLFKTVINLTSSGSLVLTPKLPRKEIVTIRSVWLFLLFFLITYRFLLVLLVIIIHIFTWSTSFFFLNFLLTLTRLTPRLKILFIWF